MRLSVTFFLLFIGFFAVSQDKVNMISGVVSDMGYPLANANIAIKGLGEGVQTDSKGRYEITARPRDVLVFSYIGMHTVEIIVEDVTSILNIDMVPKVEELDEVVVQQKKPEGQRGLMLDYASNKNIFRTAYGYIDATKTGYSMSSIDGADLNPSAIDLITALQGKIPGITVATADGVNGSSQRVIYMRGRSSANNPRPVIYEVDGTIFETAPDFLQIDNIDRVATIPGLAGVIRYGQIAAGGVIIINTKRGNVIREEGTNKVYDHAKLRNNIFDEKTGVSKLTREPPNYIGLIDSADSADDAFRIYEEQKKLFGNSAYFFIESSNVFLNKWKNTERSLGILNEMKELFADNPNVLKALAYTYEERGQLKDAMDIYIAIFKQRPRYAQSYRDLANSYTENGFYKKALSLYARYEQLRKLDTTTSDFEGIDGIIEVESTNLIAQKGDEMSISNGDILDADIGGTRVLFEWNNSEAEFDLQFVNPENHYFISSHTLQNSADMIKDEKLKGYSCEQFFIDENMPGVWRINITYFGNKGFNPTYIKATTYNDYGRPSQTKKVTLLPLVEKNINIEFLKLVVQNRLVRN
ncbi:carboxypeptidase-like regulatory domain-containing protein [Maribacter algicola]|uniref:Carboxypeptidase-like regulatory domain-containing protein n=1 Tax=Meishania litoralis TaxID=3434685 RepID=A0ACC7LRB1_9FLAO